MTDAFAFKKGVLLAETFEKVKPPLLDPTGWWISEKLDGVRAYWNGQNLYSRNGLLFDAPAWFTSELPTKVHLDGELWCGREQFERCVGIIKYHKGSTADEWKHLTFRVFDAPVVDSNTDLAYEARHAALQAATRGCKYASAVAIRKCTGKEDLDAKLQAVLRHGGEGLMLREPGSQYERKRSRSLLKVKTFLDADARVVGHSAGKGRHEGALGALQLEMPLSGKRFEVGTGFTDAQRILRQAKRAWPVGSVVTYKYQNVTAKGVPRFPVFLRARTDKTWEEVVADAAKDVADAAAVPPSLTRPPSLMRLHSTGAQPADTGGAPAAAVETPPAEAEAGSVEAARSSESSVAPAPARLKRSRSGRVLE